MGKDSSQNKRSNVGDLQGRKERTPKTARNGRLAKGLKRRNTHPAKAPDQKKRGSVAHLWMRKREGPKGMRMSRMEVVALGDVT